MSNEFKAEWLKEKRSASAKLLLIIPTVFLVFNLLMVSFMGTAPAGKSYLIATSFNWYPIMILPVVLSLLVINIGNKEKESNKVQFKSLGLSLKKQIIAKNLVILCELAIILFISLILIFLVGTFIVGEHLFFLKVVLATVCLFFGSLPILGILLLASTFLKGPVLILFNFLLTFPSAVIAVKDYWWAFPWGYNLRMMAPILGIHPNGTFLEGNSYLSDYSVLGIAIVASLLIFIVSIFLQIWIGEKRYG